MIVDITCRKSEYGSSSFLILGLKGSSSEMYNLAAPVPPIRVVNCRILAAIPAPNNLHKEIVSCQMDGQVMSVNNLDDNVITLYDIIYMPTP